MFCYLQQPVTKSRWERIYFQGCETWSLCISEYFRIIINKYKIFHQSRCKAKYIYLNLILVLKFLIHFVYKFKTMHAMRTTFTVWFAAYLELLKAANRDSLSLPPYGQLSCVSHHWPGTRWARSVRGFEIKLTMKREFCTESLLHTSFSQERERECMWMTRHEERGMVPFGDSPGLVISNHAKS